MRHGYAQGVDSFVKPQDSGNGLVTVLLLGLFFGVLRLRAAYTISRGVMG